MRSDENVVLPTPPLPLMASFMERPFDSVGPFARWSAYREHCPRVSPQRLAGFRLTGIPAFVQGNNITHKRGSARGNRRVGGPVDFFTEDESWYL